MAVISTTIYAWFEMYSPLNDYDPENKRQYSSRYAVALYLLG